MLQHLLFVRSLLLITFVFLILTSCGGATILTPEEVHAQYVQALVKNDRQTAFNLTVPEEQITIDSTLERFSDIRTGSGFYVYAKATQGAFISAEPLALVDDGQGKMGISLWQWEHARRCYQVFLAETDAGWKITKWYETVAEQLTMYPECSQTPTP